MKLKERNSRPLQHKYHDRFRESSVMVLVDDKQRLILTKRSRFVRTHRHQFSFPGGKKDSNDQTPMDTALRETEEEIGLDRKEISSVTALKDNFSPRGFVLHPFLGHVKGILQFKANRDEVEKIVRVPFSFFLKTKPFTKTYKINGYYIKADFYVFGPHLIWGATARIITWLKRNQRLLLKR